MDYTDFLKELDLRLEKYFKIQSDYVYCAKGCSACCEKGDYPLTEIELNYLMQGYLSLENDIKITVQQNIKTMKKGEKCPFLINKTCSVYKYRPIICRVHGLAYLLNDKRVKVPYCVNAGKNFHEVFNNGEIDIAPINENLDTLNILKNYECGEMRNLFDWINSLPIS